MDFHKAFPSANSYPACKVTKVTFAPALFHKKPNENNK